MVSDVERMRRQLLTNNRWVWVAFVLLFVIVAYGVAIAPDWRRALLWTTPTESVGGRMLGGMGIDWLIWGSLLIYGVYDLRRLGDRDRQARQTTLLRFLAIPGLVVGATMILDLAMAPYLGLEVNRGATGVFNPGFLAIWTLVGLLASIALFQRGSDWWFVAGVLCFVGLVLSETRAAWVALPAAAMPFVRWRARGGLIAVGLGLALAVKALRPEAPLLDTEGRLQAWFEAVRASQTHPYGNGFYSFIDHGVQANGELFDLPHSMPLQLIHDLGVVGLVAVVVVVMLGMRLRGVWLALGIAWAVYSLFWVPSIGWWFSGSILAMRAIAGGEDWEPEPALAPPSAGTRHGRIPRKQRRRW